MATYEVTNTQLGTSLSASGSVALNQSVINEILSLFPSTGTVNQVTLSSDTTVTIPAGSGITYLHTSDTSINSITVDNPSPVIVLQTSTGVEVLVNTGTSSNAHYVVVGSSGNDNIVVSGTSDVTISFGTGNSTGVGGQGNDTFFVNGGNDSITGGGGHDIIVAHGSVGDWSTAANHPTVVAGTFDLVAQSSTTDHVVLTNNTTGETIDFTGVQYVALDNNEAIIVADSTVEAGVASLYHAAFGRYADVGGTDFWFNYSHQGLSLHDIAYGFTQSSEFAPIAAMSNTDFITQLYSNTFGRAPDAGGMSYWLDQMAHGATKADLLSQFATVAALNEQGVLHTEVTIVGTVVIDPNIV